jgi:hypothetical protein
MRRAVPQIEVEMNSRRLGTGAAVVPGYRPHFRIGAGEYLGVEVATIGEASTDGRARAVVRLMYWPAVNYDALSSGASFDVLEGPNVVGHGRVVGGQHAI